MILVDLNVVFDVVQKREPHYSASAAVIGRVTEGHVSACLSAHAFKTLHYLVSRHQTAATANRVVYWLLKYFEVAGTTRGELELARTMIGLILRTRLSQQRPDLLCVHTS